MLPNTLRTLIFTLIAPCMVGIVIPRLMAGNGAFAPAAAMMVVVGLVIYGWCAVDFVRRGHGTPDPGQPPIKLVTHGLYCFSRNPMYIGVLLMGLGIAIGFSSAPVLVYLAVVAVIVHLRVVGYEEPILHRTFGAEYDDYCQRVPRWLIV